MKSIRQSRDVCWVDEEDEIEEKQVPLLVFLLMMICGIGKTEEMNCWVDEDDEVEEKLELLAVFLLAKLTVPVVRLTLVDGKNSEKKRSTHYCLRGSANDSGCVNY